ncbi:MAG: TraR/DksA C4-type zinc finger protein [Candidatus Woesebacteria bacterium]|nr:TraR/DksA C4-type zinc finger protein [Candidatus Woesebacteria bacterium]
MTKILFPKDLLKPVGDFLMSSLKALRISKKNISSEDPFNDKSRDLKYASPDTEAEEQFGHARVSAIKEELNMKAKQIKKALERVKIGKYGICEDCGKMINTDRLAVFPEATLCIDCEKKKEK